MGINNEKCIEVYKKYLSEGVARQNKILLAQKEQEIMKLNEIIRQKDDTIESLKATRESFIQTELEDYDALLLENEHLGKTVVSLSRRVAQLQKSRAYFKNEYKKVRSIVERALQAKYIENNYVSRDKLRQLIEGE